MPPRGNSIPTAPRLPIQLLKDAESRELSVPQLRGLVLNWLARHPHDAIPSDLHTLEEELLA